MTEPTGRTRWDFAAEAIKSPVVLVVSLILFLLVPLMVHLNAEPGTEVSLFMGLIKYQKAKPILPQSPTLTKVEPADTQGYYLPSTVDFKDEPIPILDRTINVGRAGSNSNAAYFIGGANVEQARIAARTWTGETIKPRFSDGKAYFTATDTVTQVEYKGNFFELITESQKGDEGTFVFSVKAIAAPSLQLKVLGAPPG